MVQKRTILYLGGPVDGIARAKLIKLVAMSSVLGKYGHKVFLLISTIPGFNEELNEYFSVPKTFQTVIIPTKYRIPDFKGKHKQTRTTIIGLQRFSASSQIAFHLKVVFSVLKYKKKKNEKVLIFTRDHYQAMLILALSRFHRIPLIYISHGLASVLLNDPMYLFSGKKSFATKVATFLTLKLDKFILKHSYGIFSATRRQLDVAKKISGGEIPPMLVIPSGVFIKDYNSFTPLKKKTQGLLNLFYAGTIRPWKGVDTILLGVAKLTKMGNPVHLTILGGTEDDPDIWRLRQLISKLNIQKNVTLKGYVPHNEVKSFMKECDLAILPYRRNLYNNYVLSPLKMFEFLAARTPMLIFDNPCIHEIVKDKETAIIIKPDVESLVNAIIDIQKNLSILDEIAEKGYKIARYYDWHVRVKTIEAFLDRLEGGELEPGQIVDRNDLLSETEIRAILQ